MFHHVSGFPDGLGLCLSNEICSATLLIKDEDTNAFHLRDEWSFSDEHLQALKRMEKQMGATRTQRSSHTRIPPCSMTKEIKETNPLVNHWYTPFSDKATCFERCPSRKILRCHSCTGALAQELVSSMHKSPSKRVNGWVIFQCHADHAASGGPFQQSPICGRKGLPRFHRAMSCIQMSLGVRFGAFPSGQQS